MKGSVTAIILAAGFSSRMGAFKALMPFGETTVLERAIVLFRDAGIKDIRVVTGHRSTEIVSHLQRLQVRSVFNGSYQEGMYSSVVAAVESLEDENGAFFLLPVDIPLVRRETIELLVRSYQNSAIGILYPAIHGKRGHPPLIANSYRERILSWKGNGGLKALLKQYEADSATIECGDEGILLDMDTAEDYERLKMSLCRETIPSRNVCEQLLNTRFPSGSPVVEHCRTVARVALLMAGKLNSCGCNLDLAIIDAAALLHDLAKGEPDHAAAGAAILRGMGYGAVADLVAVHMDLSSRADDTITAADLLYLADKLVEGDRCVSLETRFRCQLEHNADQLQILEKITRRLKIARSIQQRVEERLGIPVGDVVMAVSA